ncbi:MAG: diguanylate cyclase, partial [Clostridium sp.]
LEPALLNLELTESAYTDNPTAMKKAMTQLQNHGFTIMMDDFGSGYSSLSLLKDIKIDILKIDMRFLSDTETAGRGENIIASVIRMAKWLNIPVIAEGAETKEQVELLRSVGCDYVQGYYFARPMPVQEYKTLYLNASPVIQDDEDKMIENYCYDDLFTSKQEGKNLFHNALQATAMYEFVDDRIETIRVNEAYYALFGHDAMMTNTSNLLDVVEPQYHASLLSAFKLCAQTKKNTEYDYMCRRTIGAPLWINTKLHYISTMGKKHILIGEISDITMRKELNTELRKYRDSLLANNQDTHTVLIVDDAAINRTILKRILQQHSVFLEAENGKEAIRVLQSHRNQIDLILLDISMPVMDGKEFLQYKKNVPELDGIPVIMITADDSPEQQVITFSLGANDYIVKPFIPEVVTRRVQNVLESNYRFREMVKEYNSMSTQAKTDLMTGLINRVSAEEMMTQRLLSATSTCVMIMLDIDNFKKINDTYGHDYGDKAICAVANKLRLFFRKEDIIARMGGDEFAIFVGEIPDMEVIKNKAHQLCASMADIMINGNKTEITCSAGIAIATGKTHSFGVLYRNADQALYDAKCHGRNTVSIFSKK